MLGLFIFTAPALLLAVMAQLMVKSAYAETRRIGAKMSGFAAARHVLDAAGLHHVGIQQVPGHLSDHYDPREKVLHLSADVFHGRSLAAVGIAAHEAGHAIQHAKRYAPLAIRNAAVPVASFGSNAGWLLLFFGAVLSFEPLLLFGMVVLSGVVFFQLVNLPVEFDASARAKTQLVALGIIHQQELPFVRKVLNAAALTYVAATLHAILTLVSYLFHYLGDRR